jgi:hypothetical protein
MRLEGPGFYWLRNLEFRDFIYLFIFGCGVVLLADLLSFLVFICLNRWFKK